MPLHVLSVVQNLADTFIKHAANNSGINFHITKSPRWKKGTVYRGEELLGKEKALCVCGGGGGVSLYYVIVICKIQNVYLGFTNRTITKKKGNRFTCGALSIFKYHLG